MDAEFFYFVPQITRLFNIHKALSTLAGKHCSHNPFPTHKVGRGVAGTIRLPGNTASEAGSARQACLLVWTGFYSTC